MHDYTNITNGIISAVEREMPILQSLPDEVISNRRNHQHRTIKMLVGHMIDSASNNHQRMIRLQYAPRCGHSMPNTEMGMLTFPDYTQDNDLWISLNSWQTEDWQQLIMLWKYANLHMAHLIAHVDPTQLDNYWLDYEGNRVTLDRMIRGYLDHLNLHVGHIHELIGQSPFL